MSALIFGDNVLYTTSKIAGTTVRHWAAQAISQRIIETRGKGEVQEYSNADLQALAPTLPRPLSLHVLTLTGAPAEQVSEAAAELQISYHFGFFAPLDLANRLCITRDPLARFISCISQKIGKREFATIRDTEHLINSFDSLCLEPLPEIPRPFSYNEQWKEWQKLIIPRHFAPQYYSFGEDKGYFSRCFDISEVTTSVRQLFEAHFKVTIPSRVVNKGKKTLSLTEGQVAAVKEIYKRDYELGYC